MFSFLSEVLHVGRSVIHAIHVRDWHDIFSGCEEEIGEFDSAANFRSQRQDNELII